VATFSCGGATLGERVAVSRRVIVWSVTRPRGPGGGRFHLTAKDVRNIRLPLLASLAKVEAQKISERTKAGMARAKAKGMKIGTPKLGIELRQQIAKRAAKGQTPYAIAKALGLIVTRWRNMPLVRP
jgi:DNA invertase Pin-like site-specific DNA recombinase